MERSQAHAFTFMVSAISRVARVSKQKMRMSIVPSIFPVSDLVRYKGMRICDETFDLCFLCCVWQGRASSTSWLPKGVENARAEDIPSNPVLLRRTRVPLQPSTLRRPTRAFTAHGHNGKDRLPSDLIPGAGFPRTPVCGQLEARRSSATFPANAGFRFLRRQGKEETLQRIRVCSRRCRTTACLRFYP
jgi:hypothetical protein